MQRSVKYRIYPNKEQSEAIDKNIHSARFIYNKMLEDKIKYYKENKKMLYNTPAQYKDEFSWLKECDSLALANAQLHLDKAFTVFFRKGGFPKFKSRHKAKWSYTTNVVGENILLTDNKIRLPKIGFIRVIRHRILEGTLKSVTITKARSGKYYVSCLYDIPKEIMKIEPKTSVGLDYSSPRLYVASDHSEGNYPRFYYQSEEKLSKEQRKISHMKKGKNYEKQRIKIARIAEHIANQRKDFLHKRSTEIANRYDIVSVEDLDMKSMSRTLRFGKRTMDNGYGMFLEFLKYKLEERGKYFVKIDKWYPSTQTCSVCGYRLKEKLGLGEREWTCPECGTHHNRDYNATQNIDAEGRRTVGHTGIAR